MTNETITAALVNGLCKAWSSLNSAPFEDADATMTLLSIRPLGLEFGVLEATGASRVYSLGLRLTPVSADIEFFRKSGNPQPDAFDDHLSGLLLDAFETTVGPALQLQPLGSTGDTFATQVAGAREIH